MKKVFDQTVRDLKREVNKKVLKVPGIEQKVLDATSNEPWGPHGTLLADIAQATRNYHEFQIIMTVLWKRINDTGKNWRHVYKALTVLEYLVANGSERVIDEIRERGYQISTLSDFQYIDSSARDQGNNVRRKSQALLVLVNDKERIIEVRQKAAANRDKFRTASTGGMYRPGSGGYGDRYEDDHYEGRYGSRDDDRNGYGKDRDYNYRDDDRYGRYGDSYGRDGNRYGRECEDRYSRDGYRDDDYRGGSQSDDGYGSRGRTADTDRDHGYEDDGQASSCGSGARADDKSHDGRRFERKLSESNISAPPSYEEAVCESQSPVQSERETSASFAPGTSLPMAPQTSPPAPKAPPPHASVNSSQAPIISASPQVQEVEVVDEFDPRGPVSAFAASSTAPTVSTVPSTSMTAEMDLFGSLSDSFAPNPLAIMPVTSSSTADPEADVQMNFSGSTSDATQSTVMNQSFDNPFDDTPFKAFPSSDAISAHQQTYSPPSFQPHINQNAEILHNAAFNAESMNDFGSSSGISYSTSNVQPPLSNSQYIPQDPSIQNQEIDILADILPPSGPSVSASQPGFAAPTGQSAQAGTSGYVNFNSQAETMVPVASTIGPQAPHFGSGNYYSQGGSTAPVASNMVPQPLVGQASQFNNENFPYQGGSAAPIPATMTPQTPGGQSAPSKNGNFIMHPPSTVPVMSPSAVPVMSQTSEQTVTGPTPSQLNDGSSSLQQGSVSPIALQGGLQTATGPAAQHNSNGFSNLYSQGMSTFVASQATLPSSTGSLAIVTQPAKDKFETKSTVWADTLSRGLVNLNISGSKINPLSDIGIDFDALNRKEKRMEKQPPPSAVTSTITMGKAMGSGSGIGRAGASAIRTPPNPMMGSGMGMSGGMNMGGAPGSGMGVGGYGGMNQQGMGMGVNMGMGQRGQMQPPGSAMYGGYNPMMGGGYMPQQPYGGGYR
ncbi:hypothetical protein K2173_018130 [Erythroxylum novogranatense]|uniref:ENTH domain-containing protein n=1 Tax=Erythroxylum novogranatense TaxID=1862640 RepID=A0AAV8U7K1_9ROSI|nr:hypothetical protein K2173_018130 [Erythroxylum novogranatense]